MINKKIILINNYLQGYVGLTYILEFVKNRKIFVYDIDKKKLK